MKLTAPIFTLKRRARQLADETGSPLSAALDKIARDEGYATWSHLAAQFARLSPAQRLLPTLKRGELVLLGARPGHGKTLFGLELLLETIRDGKKGYFFTLEYTEDGTAERLKKLGATAPEFPCDLMIDTSDLICADHIIEQTSDAPAGTLVVVDYLQLLDQKRAHPDLDTQLQSLKAWAGRQGLIVILLSQIDRRFEAACREIPDLSDIRLPNPVDLSLFSKTYFMHEGSVHVGKAA
ncbi:DNA helicase [Labrenzia sp. CE80]|uniref:DNA helicase n=1 Tax=Labrenzia sp. CE80 TaxID=1788986 RepID=UPI00129B79AC|nr:DNA helicase [Labrenzia sp. CE80]